MYPAGHHHHEPDPRGADAADQGADHQPVPAQFPLLCALRDAGGDDLPEYHTNNDVAHLGHRGPDGRHRCRMARHGAIPRCGHLLRHRVSDGYAGALTLTREQGPTT